MADQQAAVAGGRPRHGPCASKRCTGRPGLEADPPAAVRQDAVEARRHVPLTCRGPRRRAVAQSVSDHEEAEEARAFTRDVVAGFEEP